MSSICTFLSGLFVLICTIWYGVGVMNDFYDPTKANDSFRYEYGSCLYVGWITGALLFLIGIGNGVSAFKAYRSKGEEYSPVYNTYKASSKGIVASVGNPVSDQKTEYV